MTAGEGAILFASALLGGALNSVAGGGSFFTFPALVLCGAPPLAANATSTVALVPGSLASASAYRADLRERETLVLSAASLCGGLLGALVLLGTPQAMFSRLVPYLMLAATLLFALGGPLGARLRARSMPAGPAGAASVPGPALPLWAAAALQLVIAVYGGFFGGGMGILMLALLSLIGGADLHRMNALKALLASCINGVAALAFVAAGVVRWPAALLMIVAAIIGGYGGARVAQRVPVPLLRRFVILCGATMTVYFFTR
jgi:uncharacterized protein